MGWFNVLMTEFIVVSGRKDGVYLVLIYRHVVIFIARFGKKKKKPVILHQKKVYPSNLNWNIHGNK